MVQFRKTKKVGPFRFSLSKKGVGVSAGAGPVRVSKGADGKVRRTVRAPGAGIYDTKVIGGRKSDKKPEPIELNIKFDQPPVGPLLTRGQLDHVRRELDRAGVTNMPDLEALELTLGDGEKILDAIGGEPFYVTQRRREDEESQRQRPLTAYTEGWWPDPFGRFPERYFDGVSWTWHVKDGIGAEVVDPRGAQ
jgi:hypothetical protein